MSTGFLRGSDPVQFDLVLWPLGLTGPRFYDVVPQNPDTRFVFLDYCCAKGLELGGAPNATALTLRAGEAAHLAGYLSGLMEARRTQPKGGRHMVSIISGEPNFPPQQALVQGFSTGVRRALPGVKIRSEYSLEYDNPATCERIANRQIDAGSGVIFAAVFQCGLGALTAAGIRGVWGVASAGEDRSHLGPHILAGVRPPRRTGRRWPGRRRRRRPWPSLASSSSSRTPARTARRRRGRRCGRRSRSRG